MEVYCTGMAQPPKGIKRAPRARWVASRGEWRTVSDTREKVWLRAELVNRVWLGEGGGDGIFG